MTDEETAEYDRMCRAVIAADAMHTNLTVENNRLRARLTAAGTSLHDTRTFPAMSEELSRLHAELEQLRAAVCRREEMLADQRTASINRIDTATALLGRWMSKGPTRGDGALNGDTRDFLGWAGPLDSAQPAAGASVGCDYPASWCAPPGCEKCSATHPGSNQPAPPTAVYHSRPDSDTFVPDQPFTAPSAGRCNATESGGVQCELDAGHEGRHECPKALARIFGVTK